MDVQNQPPHAFNCHRCGKPMDFQSEEVVADRRVAVFHCAECGTFQAAETAQAA